MRSSPTENQLPLLLISSSVTAISSSSPKREMPSPYMISNTASRKGGAHLFLMTFTRVRLPTISVPLLMASILRTSRRTEE